MASSLEKKQIDELLAKYRASAERDQRRVNELEQQNAHFAEAISSSLIVPGAAFATSYVRAYYGDEASSICGIPIDAAGGLLLKALATLLGFSSDKGAQTAGKLLHDVANGSLASWTSKLGADFGAMKRMEKPLPAPQPNAGAEGTPERAPRAMTYEEFDAIRKGMALQAKPAMPEPLSAPPRPHAPPPAPLPPPVLQKMSPAMPERPPAPPPVHAPPSTPPPMPAQQKTSLPSTKPVAAKVPALAPEPQSGTPPRSPLNAQSTPVAANAKSEAAPAVPPTPQKKLFRFTQRWAADPEADMRALLQSVGAPSDPSTVTHLLTHENPGEELKVILQRARAPA